MFEVNAHGVEWVLIDAGRAFVRAVIDGMEIEGVVSALEAERMRPVDLLELN